MSECIFCKIIAGDIPSTKVYQDEAVTAFRDINPVAPIHILIIPNRHILSVNDLEAEDKNMMGHLFTAARIIADQEGISESGYRLTVNTGPHSGQEVFHIHMHLMGGYKLGKMG